MREEACSISRGRDSRGVETIDNLEERSSDRLLAVTACQFPHCIPPPHAVPHIYTTPAGGRALCAFHGALPTACGGVRFTILRLVTSHGEYPCAGVRVARRRSCGPGK